MNFDCELIELDPSFSKTTLKIQKTKGSTKVVPILLPVCIVAIAVYAVFTMVLRK